LTASTTPIDYLNKKCSERRVLSITDWRDEERRRRRNGGACSTCLQFRCGWLTKVCMPVFFNLYTRMKPFRAFSECSWNLIQWHAGFVLFQMDGNIIFLYVVCSKNTLKYGVLQEKPSTMCTTSLWTDLCLSDCCLVKA